MKFPSVLSVILFTLVAVASFAVWAFGGSRFSSETGLYATCALVFFGLGGLALFPGTGLPRKRIAAFSFAFASAYLFYAAIWSVAWFSIPRTFGEVWGSAIGLSVFVVVLKKSLKLELRLLEATSVVFLFHTLGYYTGAAAYEALQGRGPLAVSLNLPHDAIRTLARLSWGVGYGIGLGIGINQIFHLSRQT